MFIEAEKLQKEFANFPWLYSLRGFRYCELLLAFGKWKLVKIRAEKTLEWAKTQDNLLLTMALDQLSLGRAYLQQSIYETYFDSYIPIATSKLTLLDITTNITRFESGADKIINLDVIQTSKNWIDQAISGLRKAGVEDYTIRGLLARSNYYRWLISLYSVDLDVVHLYHQLALKDLQEVYDIAERGGMSLLLTDYYLESARLALTIGLISNPFPHSDVDEYISKARQLILDTSYKRRLTELEYLEELLESI